MNKHILLVNPWVCDFAAFDLWAKPLGLLTLSTILKSCGLRVTLIDTMDRHHPTMKEFPEKNKAYGTGKYYNEIIQKPGLLREIPRHYRRYGMPPEIFHGCLDTMDKPDAILVTSLMTYWYPGVFECIQSLKKKWPAVPVILGGNYARLLPEHARNNSGADQVCTAMSMQEILPFLGKLIGCDLPLGKFDGFNQWRVPDFSGYVHPGYFVLATSIGCPFHCDYCSTPINHPGYAQNDPEMVLDQIFSLADSTGSSDLAFYDDALLVNAKSHIIPILEGLQKKNAQMRLHAPNGLHPRFISRDLAELMQKTGFKTLRLSLESSNEKIQKKSDNKVTCQGFMDAVRNLRDAGYSQSELKTYILLGVPDQKPQDLIDTTEWVFDVGAVPVLTEYSIIPGSKDWSLYAKVKGWDRLDPLMHNNSLYSVISGWWEWESLEKFKENVRKKSVSLQASS